MASVETVEKSITIPVIIGDATAVSCTLSRSLILASMEDLDNHDKDKEAHNGTFILATEKAAAGGVAPLDENAFLPKVNRGMVDDATGGKFRLGS